MVALTTIGGIPGSEIGVVTEPTAGCWGNDWYVDMGAKAFPRGGGG